jgi:hypothetical protein
VSKRLGSLYRSGPAARWPAEETEACFIFRDASGHALAYVYFEEEPGRRSAAHLLTRDEARRIAVARPAQCLAVPRPTTVVLRRPTARRFVSRWCRWTM